MKDPEKTPTKELDKDELQKVLVEKRVEVVLEGYVVQKIDDLDSKLDREFKQRRGEAREQTEHLNNLANEMRTVMGLVRSDVAKLSKEVASLKAEVGGLDGRVDTLEKTDRKTLREIVVRLDEIERELHELRGDQEIDMKLEEENAGNELP